MRIMEDVGLFYRYRADQKRVELGMPPRPPVVPELAPDSASKKRPSVPRPEQRMPAYRADPETVFLCRRVYDVKLKRVGNQGESIGPCGKACRVLCLIHS